MRRTLITATMTIGLMLVPTVAWACGGLVAPNGAVSLLRTTTMVGYVDGIEHYVTSFEFAGAGDWTLQRLQREVAPPVFFAPGAATADAAAPQKRQAKVLIEAEVDALDITVLEGGADEVILWAENNGFDLSPDASEVLGVYAARSPYFMAARFDGARAKELNQSTGDGTPIHLWIPTDDPWIPLHILALAKGPQAPVEADIFLLTEQQPTLLPAPRGFGRAGAPVADGLVLQRSEPANDLLLSDLSSDKGMKWLPKEDMWFSFLQLDAPAEDVTYDLAIDADGLKPSWRAANLLGSGLTAPDGSVGPRPFPRQVTVPVPVPVAAERPDGGINPIVALIAMAALVVVSGGIGRRSAKLAA